VHGQLTDANFHIFYHAPALILISATAQGPWIVEDCALAAENLMLAAWVSVAPIIVGHPQAVTAPVSCNEPVVRWVG
jgi:hypothetical protein